MKGLTQGSARRRANVLVMLDEQCFIVSLQQAVKFLVEPASGPLSLFDGLFLLLRDGALGLGGAFLLPHVVDVRQASERFPAADSLEHSHILVVGVVAKAKSVENVAEGLLALQVLFMLALEGLESQRMLDQRLVEGCIPWVRYLRSEQN